MSVVDHYENGSRACQGGNMLDRWMDNFTRAPPQRQQHRPEIGGKLVKS
jgi:hypothetical protein